MVHTMPEPLTYAFMQRALIAGVLLSAVAGYFSPFIVQRRMAFLGSGLAHAAFGGVALGIVLQFDPVLVALPFTVLIGIGIVLIREKTELAGDTAIGILFAVAMALGILLLSRTQQYAGDVMTYLFGSILAVQSADLVWAGGLAALTLVCARWWPVWAYATVDERLALVDRLRVKRIELALVVTVAIAIVVSAKIIGILLVSAFLVLPGATARLVARSFAGMTVWSCVFSIGGTVAGLLGSYYTDLPSGPAIVLLQAGVFFVVAATTRR
jgi:zinc transport system permease protein